jgi:outer membrane usher protein
VVDVLRAHPTSIRRFILASAVASTALAAHAHRARAEPGRAEAAAAPDGEAAATVIGEAGAALPSTGPEVDAGVVPLADTSTDASPIVAADGSAESLAASLDPQPQAPNEADKPAFLRASINEIDLGDVLVILRGGDILMRIKDLEKPGMHLESGLHEKRADGEMVSLRSLAPKLTFVFNELDLSVRIKADPSFFGAVALDLRTKRPQGLIYASSPSLFANYRLQASDLQDRNSAHLNAFTETGLSHRSFLLYNSASYDSRPTDSYDRLFHNSHWVRMMTNVTYDWRARLTRIAAGDIGVNTGDVLGGGGILGGIAATRTFALDPYFLFLPSMALSGTALTPSTVEVYVNGQLIRREILPPGQFNLQNVPLTSGSGETRVIVRDAFGGEQTMVNPYYLALGTLAKGLSDFGYNLGFLRKSYTQSWDYDQPAFAFRHRMGVSDWLTIGARAEGKPDLLSGGASVATRLVFGPVRLGELGLSVAASRQSQASGWAGLVSYAYVGRPILAQLGMRFASDHYANLSLPSEAERQRLDVSGTGAVTLNGVASIALQLDHAIMRGSGRTDTIALRVNRSLWRWLYAFGELDNIYRSSARVEFRSFFGLTFSLAERSMAALSRSDHWGEQGGHGESTQATLQQALPVGTGVGYRLAVAEGENDLNDGLVQYQGRYGRLEAEYQHKGWDSSARGQTTLTATGGAVLIGGRAYLSRPVQDAFALIRVPDVEGVHGLVSNQVVGATDRKGDLLIPSLLSYYGNRIGIDDKDIPLDHDIVATELTIAPPYRGGAIVTFPVRQVFSVAGTVVVEEGGKDIVPTYGQMVVTVAGQAIVSPFDEAGNFYLENVPSGAYQAEAQYARGTCTFPLTVQRGATALVQVGTQRCIASSNQSE